MWEHSYTVLLFPVAIVGELEQGVLEAKPLVTVVAGEGGARLDGCVSQGFSAAQWPVPTYREAGVGSKFLEPKP